MRLMPLAVRNIKRNLPKVVMYFTSLSFSVFTVYSFLALIQNPYVNAAFTYDDRYRAMLRAFGVIILVFVTFFLLSSNASFLRARKKEISTYALLGMTPQRIGRLLFIETLLVGGSALILGILGGIFFSKLVAMILLEITLSSFTGDLAFSMDSRAITLTVLPFLAVFCFMGLSGLRVISRFELVDLFKASKTPEKKGKGSTWILLLSLGLIGLGYGLACLSDLAMVSIMAIPILLLVVAGTYLFFWAGLPKLLQWRKTKLEGADLISRAAFTYRINSIGTVMASIAILSAVATTAIATGYTLYKNIETNTYSANGFDLYFYGGQEQVLAPLEAAFAEHKVKILDSYTTQRYIARPKVEPININGQVFFGEHDYFRVFSQSQAQRLLALSRSGFKQEDLRHGEAIYLYPGYYHIEAEYRSACLGMDLDFGGETIQVTSMIRSGNLAFGALHTLIISDSEFDHFLQTGAVSAWENGRVLDQVTVFKYENSLGHPEFHQAVHEILRGKVGSYRTAYNHFVEAMEVFGLVCFIGFFMSAVFILMTASLLYFKQVMAAEEERHQYRMLRKIGMNEEVERQVITKRLLPVFALPLVVGILHSIFAMKTADTLVFSHLIPVENSYLVVLGLSALMYAAYSAVYALFYFITREQYARIVR